MRRVDLDLPTHRAHALEWGDPEAPLVLVLHGFPDTAHTWRHVGPLLADAGRRVVAPFLRGYAPSGIPADGDYSVPALARDVLALHEALVGGPDAVLVGHDWGAIAANAVAADETHPFAAVVAVAVPPFAFMNPSRELFGLWLSAIVRQPFLSWYIGFNQVPGLAERHFGRLTTKLWRDWSPGFDATDDLAHLAEAVPDRAHARAVVSYYRALVRLRDPAVMGAPHGPYRYLHGADDGCLTPRLFPLVRHHLGADAVLVPGAGHFVQLERPEAVVEQILEVAP